MKKIFDHPSDAGHYQAAMAYLLCTDQRFNPARVEYFKQFSNVDPLILPGGVKAIVSPGYPGVQDYVIASIAMLQKVHGFNTLELRTHTNCAAYGGEQDPQFYEKELKAGAALVQRAIPDLSIRLVHEAFDGFYEVN